jgi:hypothetical protein
MPATATEKPTSLLSASQNLPEGCKASRQGLVLSKNLEYSSWMAVGKRLSELTGAASWMLGDWLAYGDSNYMTTVWGKRVPDGLYAEISKATGLAVQTLTNAKYVALAIPHSVRTEKLTFSHALQITAYAPKDQHKFWIGRVEKDELSVKALREAIRKSQASVKDEENDKGSVSILEVYRQFVRDHRAEAGKVELTPALKAELKKILAEVLPDLG